MIHINGQKKAASRALRQALNQQPATIDNPEDYLTSAVLLPLLEVQGETCILFEIRSAELARQPGEICFPGGRIEAVDPSPAAAALRETSEELGIGQDTIEFLGPMNYLISPIGVILYPFVGYLRQPEDVCPNPREVARTFTVPLNYLLNHRPVIGQMELASRPLPDFPLYLLDRYSNGWKRRTQYPVWFYQYEDQVIWGLTARILYSFLEKIRLLGDL
nr:CoA pyrophosphatase [Acetonema longum]